MKTVPDDIIDAQPAPQKPAKAVDAADASASPAPGAGQTREIGGRKDGPEPTRYGDWEKNGRCIDF